jgi:hypothetical protein
MENIPIIIISCAILIFLIYLHICKIKDDFSSPNPSPESNSDILVNAELEVEINQDSYRKYKTTLDKAIGTSNFKFGYTPLDSTNKDSIGFCPLGQYFSGKFTNNKLDVLSKCKKCLDCHKEKGYYLEAGCVGDTDSICKFGKVPHDIYLKSHQRGSPLHQHLPRHHTHKMYKVGLNSNNNPNYIESNNKHTHF